jgi:hypothetical protein
MQRPSVRSVAASDLITYQTNGQVGEQSTAEHERDGDHTGCQTHPMVLRAKPQVVGADVVGGGLFPHLSVGLIRDQI